MNNQHSLAFGLVSLAFSLANPSLAVADQNKPLEEIIVTGTRAKDLDAVTKTGSRLGLTLRETPAVIDILSQEQIQFKGLRSTIEAYKTVPGVAAGNIPGSAGQASMRGFGSNGISYVFDGVRLSNSTLVTRNFDTWNFERIEVLKGPASVLYGEGALAGVINLAPRHAHLGETHVDGELGYGSFNSGRAAIGVNLPFGDKVALRSDLSYTRSDGYVNDTDSKTIQFTNNLLVQPTDRLSFQLSVDYYQDKNETPYQGLPLIAPGAARDPSDIVSASNGYVVDRALRRVNYNVNDGFANSNSWWVRSKLDYELSDNWKLANELSYYDANRRWQNSEDYTYSAGSGLMNRSTTHIFHQQQAWSARSFLAYDGQIADLHNRFSFGGEYNSTAFATQRRFGNTTAVDPFNPIRGLFPTPDNAANFPGAGNRVNYNSRIESYALFGEEALNLTDKWLVVGGLRYDHISLKRTNTDLNAGTVINFGNVYKPVSWRIGTVYDLTRGTQLYAQYSKAVTPVGSLLLASLTNTNFNLTHGWSVETGVKSTLFDDKLVLGAAVYYIKQDDIVTRDPVTPSKSIQGGSQSSRGVELSASLAVTPQFHVDGNLALLRAKFDTLYGAGGVNLAGNRPVNVPQQLANLSAYYTFDALPVTAGASLHYSGDIYTSTTNTVRVKGAAIVDGQISYRLPYGTLALRGRNLFNKFYADWSGYSATQVFIGAPRSVDATLTVGF